MGAFIAGSALVRRDFAVRADAVIVSMQQVMTSVRNMRVRI